MTTTRPQNPCGKPSRGFASEGADVQGSCLGAFALTILDPLTWLEWPFVPPERRTIIRAHPSPWTSCLLTQWLTLLLA